MNKNTKKAIFSIATLMASAFLMPQATHATTNQTASIKASIEETLSLVLSKDSMVLNLGTPGLHTDTMDVTGQTNSANGYTISFKANNDYNDLKHANSSIENKIPSIEEDVTESTFPNKTWGYSIDESDYTFKKIPLTQKNIFTTSTLGGSTNSFTVGIKGDPSLVSGSYENELLFTIVANPNVNSNPGSNDGICNVTRYMQDVETWAPSLELGQQIQVTDKRDCKTYWVAKLKDGNIWMTQNLDLDLSPSVTLTPEDSDVSENWTPSNATVTGIGSLGAGIWKNSNIEPSSFDLGDYYFDGAYSEGEGCNYLTTANCEHFSTTAYARNGEHGHVGNLYNWLAAAALDYDDYVRSDGAIADSSICPKGWRLPYGHNSSRGDDFATLSTAYNASATSDAVSIDAPLFFVRSGYINDGYFESYANTSSGHYWTSTIASHSSGRYYEYYYANEYVINSSTTNSNSSATHSTGNSIRCLAR